MIHDLPEEGDRESIAPKDGVLKLTLKKGKGLRRPVRGDQVDVRYIMKVPRGSPNAGKELSRGRVERYNIGSGQVCRGLDVTLGTMVEGEHATVRLKRAYAGDTEARECFVELAKIHDDQLLARGGVIRTRERPPESTPEPGECVQPWSRVTVNVAAAAEASAAHLAVGNLTLEFTVGEGAAPLGIEKGVLDLVQGEVVELLMDPLFCEADQAPSPIVALADEKEGANLSVRVLKVSAPEEMDIDTLLRVATRLKAQGNMALAACSTRRAWEKYAQGCTLLEENAETLQSVDGVETIHLALLLNRALTANKLGNFCGGGDYWQDAETSCNKALALEAFNVKALFRRGQARIYLNKWAEAREDLAAAQAADEGIVKDAKRELAKLKKLEDASNAKQAKMFQKAFAKGNELYSEEERAPRGLAFPCKKEVTAVDLEEYFEEIEIEEEEEETRVMARAALDKGQRCKGMAPVNPWDRDGKKQELDQHKSMYAEAAQAENIRKEKHYKSGRWMKNHPVHHQEWLERRANRNADSDEEDEEDEEF